MRSLSGERMAACSSLASGGDRDWSSLSLAVPVQSNQVICLAPQTKAHTSAC